MFHKNQVARTFDNIRLLYILSITHTRPNGSVRARNFTTSFIKKWPGALFAYWKSFSTSALHGIEHSVHVGNVLICYILYGAQKVAPSRGENQHIPHRCGSSLFSLPRDLKDCMAVCLMYDVLSFFASLLEWV